MNNVASNVSADRFAAFAIICTVWSAGFLRVQRKIVPLVTNTISKK